MDAKMNYKKNKDRIDVQFFIDRRGNIHKYKGCMFKEVVSMHYEIANNLFQNIKYPRKPDDVVMNLGWILIGSSVYGSAIIKKKPTQAQIKALTRIGLYDRLCFEHKGYWINYDKYKILL
ncbi:hypothetical protein ACFQZW_12950 [Lutibacter aestuarii]|uniref:Uncharacterized protein n=1 Tax=Lutibacter aestuarii TaxID=861111 RepID=A0ABW2Z8S7_9FLAO